MNDDTPAPPAEQPAAATRVGPEETPREFVVSIPARRGWEPPLAIAVEDEDVANALRRVVKGALRRQEFNQAMAALERRRAEVQLLEQHLQLDPVGTIVEQIRADVQVELALHLLSLPEVFAQVSPVVLAWQDEAVRTRRREELARVRAAARQAAETELAKIARTEPPAAEPVQSHPQPERPARIVRARRVL
jgi:hypothetical protein